jgi:uncharacterized protein YlxP (DUF503 family)
VVLSSRYELRLPGCRSLKEKRSRLRPVVDRVRHRHHTSVAETDRQDAWDRAVVEVAIVAPTPSRAEELLDVIDRVVWSADGIEVLESRRTWLDPD